MTARRGRKEDIYDSNEEESAIDEKTWSEK